MDYKCRQCKEDISGSDVFTSDNYLFCCSECANEWKKGQNESFPLKFREDHGFWGKEEFVGGPMKKWWFWDVHFALNDIHKKMADIGQVNSLSLEIRDAEERVDRMGKFLSDFGAMQVNLDARVKNIEKRTAEPTKALDEDIRDIKDALRVLDGLMEKINRLERLMETKEGNTLNSLN